MPNPKVADRVVQGGKMTALRLDPKIRYLADIAALAKGESLTKYFEAALLQTFKDVTLRVPPEREPSLDASGNWIMPDPLDPESERLADNHMSVANQGDLLWSESEYVRMLMLSMIAPRLQENDDKALLQYVQSRKDLWKSSEGGHKPDRDKIDKEWEAIKAAFAKSKATKGRVK
jgi:hypothetical protein